MRSFKLGDITLADTRSRRIGMIVPASNTNAEPDCLSQATRDRHEQYRGRRLSVYSPELVVDIGV
jgi:maleate cis-trans isomerase